MFEIFDVLGTFMTFWSLSVLWKFLWLPIRRSCLRVSPHVSATAAGPDAAANPGDDADMVDAEIADSQAETEPLRQAPNPGADPGAGSSTAPSLAIDPAVLAAGIAAALPALLPAIVPHIAAALQQGMPTPGGSAGGSRSKAKRPEVWDGVKISADEFLTSLESFFEAEDVPANRQARTARTYLTPAMQTWFKNYCRFHSIVIDTLDWAGFVQVIREGRRTVDPQTTLRAELQRLKLLPGKATQYASDFMAIVAKAVDAPFLFSAVEQIEFVKRSARSHYRALYDKILFNPQGGYWTDIGALLKMVCDLDGQLARTVSQPTNPSGDASQAKDYTGKADAAADHGRGKRKRTGRPPTAPAPTTSGKTRTKWVDGAVWRDRLAKGQCPFCGSTSHAKHACPHKRADPPAK
jgi:hypothetical protein